VRGVELYTQGDFPNAWLEFNSAYQIVPLVDLLNNVARCEVRMGRPQQALEHFQRFIAARPTDQDSEYIRQEIARLEGELGRTKTTAATPEPEKTAVPTAPRRVPIYGILTGVSTLALVIAGAATLGVTNSAYNDLQVRCSPTCFAEDVSVLQRQANAGYGLLGVAAAGAIATGVVLYFELRPSKETSLRPLARLGGGAPIGFIGRF
jgi:tetratricopeptide (TPR) repeat protein